MSLKDFKNPMLLRDAYNKLSSTFGRNSNKRIAVLKTASQGNGGAWGALGATGKLGTEKLGTTTLFKGNDNYNVLGSVLGDIFGTNSKDIMADVIFSYNHRASVKLTENPVESGVIVNDHRIIEARSLVIEIGVNSGNITERNTPILRGAGLMLFGDSPNSQNAVINTYADLLMCQRNGEPFDIETPVGTYKNMLITNIEALQDAETINVFKGHITFRELLTYEIKKSTRITDKSGVLAKLQTGLNATKEVTSLYLSFLPTSAKTKIQGLL